MPSNFERWEKDPFFSAAEEVQDSADRMESAYRRWIHARKSYPGFVALLSELRADLHTALGTVKWQLEEFDRAARSSYGGSLMVDLATRHQQFVIAIESQISKVENSLRELMLAEGKAMLPWVRLDEGERDELALFLVGNSAAVRSGGALSTAPAAANDDHEKDLVKPPLAEMVPDGLGDLSDVELGRQEITGEGRGHRRTASASANIGSWKVSVSEEDIRKNPPRNLSFSSLVRTLESASKFKWPKNGFRKLKSGDRSHQCSRGTNSCYERSKICLDSCDESYNKQLHGWIGAFQRQLQRSQCQIQYGCPLHMTFWASVVLCFIFIFVLWTT